jgi:hypothetical protein
MPAIVTEGDRLGEVDVEAKSASDGGPNLCNL